MGIAKPVISSQFHPSRHFKLSRLIETVEMRQEDEEDEPGDQKGPVSGVQWSRKGGYLLFVRRKASWTSAPLRCICACCDSATPLVSKWLKQHLTFRRKVRGDSSMVLRKAERDKYLNRVGQLGRIR